MSETPDNILDIDFVALNERLNKEQKQKRNRELNDLRKVLKTPEGRRLIWKRLCDATIFQSGFSTNALQMAFMAGERNQGLRLLTDITEVDDDAFYQMFREYISELRSRQKKEEEPNGRPAITG